MKKLIAMLLCLVMVAAMFAGCGKQDGNEETVPTEMEPATEEVTEQATEAPASSGAVEILANIWAAYGEDEKFMAMGGDSNNIVDGAPGAFALDAELLSYQLLVPAEQVENIDDAAGLFHGMMLNNFTAGAFHITGDVDAFAEAMRDAVLNNQWMCGFPEKLVVAVVDGGYVVMAYGLNDFITPFTTHLSEVYADAQIRYTEDLV